MNRFVGVFTPLGAVIAIAACSSSGMPLPNGAATAGQVPMASIVPRARIPQWMAQELAQPACPQVTGGTKVLARIKRATQEAAQCDYERE